ncbi:MAG TPA: alpha/beta hydrolase [Pseudonocardiaceae bacterium]|jgi:acetyl esterase/lipase|nr:alpha/beta hydrolase [Pseudonocardiaceae bacterium]
MRDNRAGVVLAVGAATVGVALNVFGRRTPWTRYPWYVPGMLTGIGGTELGAPMAATQAVAGGIALGLGAGRSRLGTAGLAVAAGTAAGLVGLHRHTSASTDILAEALGAELARDGTKPATPLAIRGIRYHDEAREQVLDLYHPHGLVTRAPVLVYVHGGSWVGGSRRGQGTHLIREMVGRGWLCVSIDYRLGPHNRWPTMIVDVKRAIAWVRATIHEYGGDPGFVAVAGGSAGGHLATLAALSGNDFQPGFASEDTSVQAAASLYAVYDLTARNADGTTRLRDYVRKVMFDTDLADDPTTWRGASPTWRLTEEAPPIFVVHGDRDEIVSVTQARRFADRARETVRRPFGYAELPYAHHGFDMIGSQRTKATVRAVGQFLDTARTVT